MDRTHPKLVPLLPCDQVLLLSSFFDLLVGEWVMAESFLPESGTSCWIFDKDLGCESVAGLVISKASESRADAGMLFDANRRALPRTSRKNRNHFPVIEPMWDLSGLTFEWFFFPGWSENVHGASWWLIPEVAHDLLGQFCDEEVSGLFAVVSRQVGVAVGGRGGEDKSKSVRGGLFYNIFC